MLIEFMLHPTAFCLQAEDACNILSELLQCCWPTHSRYNRTGNVEDDLVTLVRRLAFICRLYRHDRISFEKSPHTQQP